MRITDRPILFVACGLILFTNGVARACPLIATTVSPFGRNAEGSKFLYSVEVQADNGNPVSFHLLVGARGRPTTVFLARSVIPKLPNRYADHYEAEVMLWSHDASLSTAAISDVTPSGVAPISCLVTWSESLPHAQLLDIHNQRSDPYALLVNDNIITSNRFPPDGQAKPFDLTYIPVDPANVFKSSAEYPEFAKQRGIEGRVVLTVLVGASEHPINIWIENSSNSDLLDQSALRAVMNSTFVPAYFESQPVFQLYRVVYEFKLEG
jgi:TonB family protein